MRVGFAGLGSMGLPMARNLVAAGHEVVVWNRTHSRAEALEGARVAESPADAARGAEALVTMLADDAAVEEVLFGADGRAGALDGLGAGAVHVSSSTISVALAQRIAEAHAERGQRFVSAPVFGRPDAAAAAKLRVVAAGAPEAVAAVRPLFAALGQQTFEVGPEPFAANVVKLAGNFMIAGMVEMLGEVFAFGRKQGVEAEAMRAVLGPTLLESPIFAGYARLVAEERWEPAGFRLRLGLKDVRLVLAAAHAAGAPMPLASLVHDRLLGGVAQGLGDLDWAAGAKLVARDAGLER